MGKIYKKTALLIFFTGILVLLITCPHFTLKYAKAGLQIWYINMIPALLPMMIITGCMIKLNITASFASVLYPITHKIYHLSKNGTYAVIIGFLCGFPMGAKVICELYIHNKITKMEADTLLPICNNIGPVFMLTYGLRSFPKDSIYIILILFYIIPLVYAYFLFKSKKHSYQNTKTNVTYSQSNHMTFSVALDEAISESAAGMLSLGGYIIFFSILTLIPRELLHLPDKVTSVFTCLLEITNGLSYPSVLPPHMILSLLQFGGICCIFQTIKFVSKTDLDLKNYFLHKIALTVLTFLFFYVICNLLF